MLSNQQQQLLILCSQSLTLFSVCLLPEPLLGWHTRRATLPPLVCCRQEVVHHLSLLLLFLFVDRGAIAQQVGPAHIVRTRILVIAHPPIMHRTSIKTWQVQVTTQTFPADEVGLLDLCRTPRCCVAPQSYHTVKLDR